MTTRLIETRVVFEYPFGKYNYRSCEGLIETRVVFEYEIEGYSWDKDNRLIETRVVFELKLNHFVKQLLQLD